MKLKIVISCLLAASVSSVQALEFGQPFVSASATSANYDVESVDDRASGFMISTGISIKNSNNSLELGFANLGEVDGELFGYDVTLDATSIFVDLKTEYKVANKFNAYTKIGLNRLSGGGSIEGESVPTETETKLMYGIGSQYNIANNFSISADYTVLASDVSYVGLGLISKF